MSVTLYNLLRKRIIVNEGKVFICEQSNKAVYTFSREGYGIERLFSEIFVIFLRAFCRGEQKKKLTVNKNFANLTEDTSGRLRFYFESYIDLE